MTPNPLLLDLCCGLGGWARGFIAEGWDAVGVDILDFSAQYPGRFIQADLLIWDGYRALSPRLIVASPPCQEFSRHSMPWTRAKNPPPPDTRLWRRCEQIARELGRPLIIENVRGAQPFMGRSKINCGPFHFWGDSPACIPQWPCRRKEGLSSTKAQERAIIDFDLVRHIARACKNSPSVSSVSSVVSSPPYAPP